MILKFLDGNPRIGMTELARAVSMSPPSVRERVQRLERSGVIRGFSLNLDPAEYGYALSAWIRLRPGPGQLARAARKAQETWEVSECYRMSGGSALWIRIHGEDMAYLERLLDEFAVFGSAELDTVICTLVEPRAVLPVRRP